MNKSGIRYVILLMSISLVGLILIQFYWISNDLKLQQRQFDENVNSALRASVKTLEKRIAANMLVSQIFDSTRHKQEALLKDDEAFRIVQNEKRTNIIQDSLMTRSSQYQKKILIKEFKNQRHRKEIKVEESEREISFRNKDFKFPLEATSKKYAELPHKNHLLKNFFDSVQTALNKAEIIRGLVVDFSLGNKNSLDLINPSALDSIVRKELQQNGVNTNYSYGILHPKNDSLIYCSSKNDAEYLKISEYKTPLFSNEFFKNTDFLTLYFPSKSNFLFRQMAFVLMLSAGLILLILLSFSYILSNIFRQKKISEMKTDFINNMTHEFKTPVSTILLASEALQDPQIGRDPERLTRLAGIIHEENNRMGKQVERVLQIAALEREDFKLQPYESDLHQLIQKVADSIYLQVESRKGRINCKLLAQHYHIRVDELHFSNVLYNLLDNAIKYSAQAPEITVCTADTATGFLISVEDKGIGMSMEQQKLIFEKFYRVPTGNLHNVKGFGLGLSYVKKIVSMLNGTIKVKSAPGEGSRFEIFLPRLPKT
jgi:two-component system phosphate regulon sensor histidine kinase PhoR